MAKKLPTLKTPEDITGKTFILGTLWNHPSTQSIARGLKNRGAHLIKKEDLLALSQSSFAEAKKLKIAGIILPSAESTKDNEWLSAFFHCPIFSELDLAQRLTTVPIIAITGTNGKTSSTELTAQCLQQCGKKVGLYYNFEKSIMEIEDVLDYAVTECWSAQLETSQSFKPSISVLLNVEADHIDQHGSLKKYIETKRNIFLNQKRSDTLVYNHNCKITRQLVKKYAPASVRRIAFSGKDPGLTVKEAVFLKKGIVYHRNGTRVRLIARFSTLPQLGNHFDLNRLAVLAVGLALQLDLSQFESTFHHYKQQPHRQEVFSIGPTFSFVDDAISSGFHSARIALQRFMDKKHAPLVWLTGGRDKNFPERTINEFVGWYKKSAQGFRPRTALILLGEFPRFEQALKKNKIFFRKFSTLDQAIEEAAKIMKSGGTLLFSPIGAADDLFNEYDDRGQAFKQVVRFRFR